MLSSTAALFLLHEVVRGLAAHVDKVLGERLILLVARGAPQAHQRELHLGVAGACARVLLHKLLIDAVRIFRHDVEQAALAGHIIVRGGGLHHVAGAVELVRLAHIRPHLVRRLDREIRVDIAVLMLGFAVQRDHIVHGLFELGVLAGREGVRRRLDPLRDVAVLKHHAVKFLGLHIAALELLRREADVLDGVALLHVRHLVVQNLVLIGQNLLAHELLHAAGKAVVRAECLEGNSIAFHVDHHLSRGRYFGPGLSLTSFQKMR